MNREHWKMMLPYVTAFANGERVECWEGGSGWFTHSNMRFDGSPDTYRTVSAPKLRPWTVKEREDRVIRRAVVRHTQTGTVDTFLGLDRDGNVQMSAAWASAQELADVYELIGIDGARLPEPEPCGVRE